MYSAHSSRGFLPAHRSYFLYLAVYDLCAYVICYLFILISHFFMLQPSAVQWYATINQIYFNLASCLNSLQWRLVSEELSYKVKVLTYYLIWLFFQLLCLLKLEIWRDILVEFSSFIDIVVDGMFMNQLICFHENLLVSFSLFSSPCSDITFVEISSFLRR